MRTAFPIHGTELSPSFDFAQRILVVESDRNDEIPRFVCDLPKESMSSRSQRLRELRVDVLVCGAVSNPLAGMLHTAGIRLIPWKCGHVGDVLEAYFTGSLEDARFSMPGHRGQGIPPAGNVAELRRDPL